MVLTVLCYSLILLLFFDNFFRLGQFFEVILRVYRANKHILIMLNLLCLSLLSQKTNAMHHIVFVMPIIFVAIRPGENSSALLFPMVPFTIIIVTVWSSKLSIDMMVLYEPVAFVFGWAWPTFYSKPVLLIVSPLSIVNFAVNLDHTASTV